VPRGVLSSSAGTCRDLHDAIQFWTSKSWPVFAQVKKVFGVGSG
jgi:hypothetical protein